MKKQLKKLPGVRNISKTEQKFISGGFVVTNIPCQTKMDCFEVTMDFADFCYNGFCIAR